MQQILQFLRKNKYFLLFLFLFSIAFLLTLNASSYKNNSFTNSTRFLTGGVYSVRATLTQYFNLSKQNNELIKENAALRKQLEQLKQITTPQDTIGLNAPFIFNHATVIKNSFAQSKNYLTLDKGLRDSLTTDMGVITPQGIVGVVNRVSENFATVQSILHTQSQINAKLKKSNHLGFLSWKGFQPNEIEIIDIPRQAQLAVGDTVVTDGSSTIFPEGIPIGSISNFTLEDEDDYYSITISLFNDMTQLRNVYVITNTNKEEILELENINNAQE